MFDKSQKELLREEFQLVAPNLRMIIHKKAEHLNYYERELLSNVLKKVIFIRESFDTRATIFNKMTLNLELENHQPNQIVFKKGDKGDYFYIVLEGIYYVQTENSKDKRKQKNIYYYPGDSFGQVSLIYDVPRGATIVANKESSLIRIPKAIFNQCGNLQKSIKYLNAFFQNHSYFEKEDKFMIRIVSSLSNLVKFNEKQVLMEEGQPCAEILFFSKGQANIYKRLKLENKSEVWYETILMGKLSDGDVFGEKFYVQKQPSTVKIVSVTRGQYIKVSFKDNISTIQTPLYKRIRQNALRYPSDDELLQQYKIFIVQKCKQMQFLQTLYKNDKNIKDELKHAKSVCLKVKDCKLAK